MRRRCPRTVAAAAGGVRARLGSRPLQLGAGEVGTVLPPVFGYWRDLGARYVTAVCTLPDVGDGRALAAGPAAADERARIAGRRPRRR